MFVDPTGLFTQGAWESLGRQNPEGFSEGAAQAGEFATDPVNLYKIGHGISYAAARSYVHAERGEYGWSTAYGGLAVMGVVGTAAMGVGGSRIFSAMANEARVATSVSTINSRLTGKVAAWKRYQAGGGKLSMAKWNKTGGVKSNYGNPYTMSKGFAQWVRNPLKIHGNSMQSSKLTYLYRLETRAGEFLKWGISSNPAGRYSSSYMLNKYLKPIAHGPRRDMLKLERMHVETNPGPLNFEPWSGIRVGQ